MKMSYAQVNTSNKLANSSQSSSQSLYKSPKKPKLIPFFKKIVLRPIKLMNSTCACGKKDEREQRSLTIHSNDEGIKNKIVLGSNKDTNLRCEHIPKELCHVEFIQTSRFQHLNDSFPFLTIPNFKKKGKNEGKIHVNDREVNHIYTELQNDDSLFLYNKQIEYKVYLIENLDSQILPQRLLDLEKLEKKKLHDSLREKFLCPICQSISTNTKKCKGCKIKICEICWKKWSKTSGKCAYCNEKQEFVNDTEFDELVWCLAQTGALFDHNDSNEPYVTYVKNSSLAKKNKYSKVVKFHLKKDINYLKNERICTNESLEYDYVEEKISEVIQID